MLFTSHNAQASRMYLLESNCAGFLPTVVTTSRKAYRSILPKLAELISLPEFRGRILGIHLEGPFISDKDGAVGAHNAAYVTQNVKAEALASEDQDERLASSVEALQAFKTHS